MGLKSWTDGEILYADILNNVIDEALSNNILSKITTLQDRAVSESAGQTDLFAEAYSSSAGRQGYVNITNTEALFVTDRYKATVDTDVSGDTTSNPDSWSNPDNSFDLDDSTYAELNSSGAAYSTAKTFGKTFTSKYVSSIRINLEWTAVSSTFAGTFKIQTYDGVIWNDIYTESVATNPDSTFYYNDIYSINDTIQGVRVYFQTTNNRTWNNKIYEITYGDLEDSLIEHDIPTGFFNSTPNSMICMPKIVDWEDGANIQGKVQVVDYSTSISESVFGSIVDTSNYSNPTHVLTPSKKIKVYSITKEPTSTLTSVTLKGSTATFIGNIAVFSSPIEIDKNESNNITSVGDGYRITDPNVNNNNVHLYFTGISTTTAGIISIQYYEYDNVLQDSGYVDYGEVLNFIDFTSEPNKFIVKLVPKTTSPTAGYPSISGTGCIVR